RPRRSRKASSRGRRRSDRRRPFSGIRARLRKRSLRESPGADGKKRSGMTGAMSRRLRRGLALAASAILAAGCARQEARAPVVVRNPDYLVVRPIRREADAEHTIRVELPYSGAGYGFASAEALLNLNSFDLAAAGFSGGRTSVVGEATIWLPL